ncbi:hypothetical protein [uncultured Desulfovibrio sp.]|nr:hypothetical protein [uncultured Desulfovibrio sp.]
MEDFAVLDMDRSVYPVPGIVIRPGLAYISDTARAGPDYSLF